MATLQRKKKIKKSLILDQQTTGRLDISEGDILPAVGQVNKCCLQQPSYDLKTVHEIKKKNQKIETNKKAKKKITFK